MMSDDTMVMDLLALQGSNSKHGTVLKGQHDRPRDGIYMPGRVRQGEKLEGFTSLLHPLDRMVDDFNTTILWCIRNCDKNSQDGAVYRQSSKDLSHML